MKVEYVNRKTSVLVPVLILILTTILLTIFSAVMSQLWGIDLAQ